MLNWFFACQNEYQLNLYIFHLNHKLRPEAKEEAQFVQNLAAKLSLPVAIKEFPVKLYCQEHKVSLQVGARIIRYQLLNEVASEVGATKIALAHHADDQAETILRNLLKGTGLKGLAGMPIKRGNIIRPLLFCRRLEILNYLDALGATYKVDLSNFDTSYLRNYLRLKVMPLLVQQNPNFVEQVLTLSQILAEDEAYLSQTASKELEEQKLTVDTEIHLKLHQIRSLPPAIGKRVLRLAIAKVKGDLEKITFTHTNLIWEDMVIGKLKALNLPDKTVVLRENDCLVIFKPKEAITEKVELKAGSSTIFNNYQINLIFTSKDKIKFQPNIHWLDAQKINWPLFARSFKPGDRFTPLGLKGSKKVHDFFIDAKIKKRERPLLPIIVDRDDNIVAVGHLRVADPYKITAQTEAVVRIKIERRKFV